MAACRTEAERYYGQPVALQVVNRRHTSNGLKVKLAARLDADNVEFLHCWVSQEDAPDRVAAVRSDAPLVARIEPVPALR